MKIVIAPDSFKESMTALAAAEAIERGVKKVDTHYQTIKVPLGDGGEGTMEAIIDALGGTYVTHMVAGPFGEPMEASYGITKDGTAIIEAAAVCGLDLLAPDQRDPLIATTYGLGELIRYALDQNIRDFMIGLGGSATNDGGLGMAQALGASLTNAAGEPVPYGGEGVMAFAGLAIEGLDPRLADCTFRVACDVSNPLTGKAGATYTYGPQKGVTPEMAPVLDQAMEKYGQALEQVFQKDIRTIPGAGAAGGLGAACLAFLDAALELGIEIVMALTDLEKHIMQADVVFTGEGKMDDQTVYGKTAAGVARLAKKHDVPVIVLTGANQLTSDVLYEAGITAVFPIVDGPMTLEKSMGNAPQFLEKTASNIIRIFRQTHG